MRLRAAIGLVAFVAALLPVVPAASPACAAEASHVALVVSTGKDVLRYCVTLDRPSVSGLRLIELAHDQYGLSYRSDGAAVCMLADVGTTEGDCFGDYPDYWGYWRGNGSGGWVWAGSGAASTSVRQGQVEGWTWGTGDNGASHPRPPATTFSSVCASTEPTPSPAPVRSPPSRPTPSPAHTRAAAAPSPAASTPPSTPAASPRASQGHKPPPRPRKTKLAAAPARPRARSSPLAATAAGKPGGGSIPGAGVAALLVAAGLGVAGLLLVRRRHLNA